MENHPNNPENNDDDDKGSALLAVRRISWLGIYVNLLLTVMKFLAGFFGNSSVLIADAVNSLSDMITDIVVLVGSRFWGRPADEEHPYGHAKIETIITLFIGIAVFLVGLGLVYGSIGTIFGILKGEKILAPTLLPFVVAIIAMIIKQYLYVIMLRTGMRVKSSALIANAWNHQSDILASIPAVAALGASLLLGENYAFLDPVGSIVISFMIMFAAWGIARPSLNILLDSGTSREHYERISNTIDSFEEVVNFEKLRTRMLGPSGISVDVHVRVDAEMTVWQAHELSHKIKNKLAEEDKNVIEVHIHIEPA